MSRVAFEPTIPVFERAQTVHALDRAATVIGLTYTRILFSAGTLAILTEAFPIVLSSCR
jgi:hypothetical protein